jgi:ectoine hydroxylase
VPETDPTLLVQYWYTGYLRPDLGSCFIAIDPATEENGALTVLRGSHLAGRIEHGIVRGQPGGNLERVSARRG